MLDCVEDVKYGAGYLVDSVIILDKNSISIQPDTMIKIKEEKVNELHNNLRLACMLLANVADEKTMMPSLNGIPMNSLQVFTYFNMGSESFAKIYYQLLRDNIIATLTTGNLECIILNPDYFTGYDDDSIWYVVNIFESNNIYIEENGIKVMQENTGILAKRMRHFKKMGYI